MPIGNIVRAIIRVHNQRKLTVSHEETSKCEGFEGEKRTEETLSNGGEESSICSEFGTK
jgi:hypothetical protein